MREILFRGKRTGDGAWIEGGIWIEDNDVFIIGPIRYFPDTRDWDTYEYYVKNPVYRMGKNRVDPETVGQFTGLLDMNGKKIFEGDIVEVDGAVYVCRWDMGNFEFGLANAQESFGIVYASHRIEVTATVHDNPDLLKGD